MSMRQCSSLSVHVLVPLEKKSFVRHSYSSANDCELRMSTRCMFVTLETVSTVIEVFTLTEQPNQTVLARLGYIAGPSANQFGKVWPRSHYVLQLFLN